MSDLSAILVSGTTTTNCEPIAVTADHQQRMFVNSSFKTRPFHYRRNVTQYRRNVTQYLRNVTQYLHNLKRLRFKTLFADHRCLCLLHVLSPPSVPKCRNCTVQFRNWIPVSKVVSNHVISNLYGAFSKLRKFANCTQHTADTPIMRHSKNICFVYAMQH